MPGSIRIAGRIASGCFAALLVAALPAASAPAQWSPDATKDLGVGFGQMALSQSALSAPSPSRTALSAGHVELGPSAQPSDASTKFRRQTRSAFELGKRGQRRSAEMIKVTNIERLPRAVNDPAEELGADGHHIRALPWDDACVGAEPVHFARGHEVQTLAGEADDLGFDTRAVAGDHVTGVTDRSLATDRLERESDAAGENGDDRRDRIKRDFKK